MGHANLCIQQHLNQQVISFIGNSTHIECNPIVGGFPIVRTDLIFCEILRPPPSGASAQHQQSGAERSEPPHHTD